MLESKEKVSNLVALALLVVSIFLSVNTIVKDSSEHELRKQIEQEKIKAREAANFCYLDEPVNF